MSNAIKDMTYDIEKLTEQLWNDRYCISMFGGILPAFNSIEELRADLERRVDAGVPSNPHSMIQQFESELPEGA